MLRTTYTAVIAFAAAVATPATAAEFHMIHQTRGNMSIGVFTPDGPQLGTMQKGASRVDFITYDPSTQTYFGQQVSEVGVIANGGFTTIERPENVDLSHSGGLAFDTDRGSVLVASRSGAGTVLFEFTPAANEWTEIGNIGRDDFHGLACDGGQGLIYVLDKPHHTRGCTNVRVFNRTGAQVAAVDLSTPIPFYSELRPRLQLAFADGALYTMIACAETHPRVTDAIYAIDLASGAVTRTPFNASVDVTSKTWPGWTGGPPPSPPMVQAGAAGRGAFSGYETPAPLVSGQPNELHVVAIEAGEMNYLEYLKKIKKVRASSGAQGVGIELELDLDAEIKHPVVEVAVGRTAKPVTLVLVSGSTVIWSIDAAPAAQIAKVITYDAPHFSESRVIGIDETLVAGGGATRAASAWELSESSSAAKFDEMIDVIRTATGLRENSFQGLGRATAFHVPWSAASGVRQASVDERE